PARVHVGGGFAVEADAIAPKLTPCHKLHNGTHPNGAWAYQDDEADRTYCRSTGSTAADIYKRSLSPLINFLPFPATLRRSYTPTLANDSEQSNQKKLKLELATRNRE